MPPITPPEARLISLPEAARRLGIGVRQLEAARDAGQLPVYRVGAWPRTTMRDVTVWLQDRREPRR